MSRSRVRALEVLEEMLDAGLRVEADRPYLRVRPAARLTDDLRRRAQELKPELLDALDPPKPDGPCSDCGGVNYVRPAVGRWECLDCTSLPPERIVASFHGPDKWAGRTEGAA